MKSVGTNVVRFEMKMMKTILALVTFVLFIGLSFAFLLQTTRCYKSGYCFGMSKVLCFMYKLFEGNAFALVAYVLLFMIFPIIILAFLLAKFDEGGN